MARPFDAAAMWHLLPDGRQLTVQEIHRAVGDRVRNEQGAEIAIKVLKSYGWLSGDGPWFKVTGEQRPATDIEYYYRTLPSPAFTTHEAAKKWNMSTGGAHKRLNKLRVWGIVTWKKEGRFQYAVRKWKVNQDAWKAYEETELCRESAD